MIKFRTERVIDCNEWDRLVQRTYGRRYCFQQQDGCQDRGYVPITVPDTEFDFENDTVPEEVNHGDMGVSFKAWLERDPNQKIEGQKYDYELDLWWHRNFYPEVQTLAADLHAKGLIEAGEYVIDIDW